MIIHEDFSENYQTKHQREVMAAHWLNDTVTLFTAVVYYRSVKGDLEHKSYAVISDDIRHDKQNVYAFNKVILEEVKQITPVTKVHFWSYGAASQFKQTCFFMSKTLVPRQHGTVLKLRTEKGLWMVLVAKSSEGSGILFYRT